jgi:2-oxoglutarate dehydrogenase complex dehydrogenase (E1) component-like enzyme
MAPSVRGTSSRVSKRQASIRTNAKVSKAIKNHPTVKEELGEVALKQVVISKKSVKQTGKHVPKRKRDEVEDESETEAVNAQVSSVNGKKV